MAPGRILHQYCIWHCDKAVEDAVGFVGRRRSLAQVSGCSLFPNLNREASGRAAGLPFSVLLWFLHLHLLQVIISVVVDAVPFAGDGAKYPLGNSSCCTWLLLNPVPKTSSVVNLGSGEQPARQRRQPKSTLSWPRSPPSSGDKNVQCAGNRVPGFFWHGSAKPKASRRHFIFLSGISFSAEGWVWASKAVVRAKDSSSLQRFPSTQLIWCQKFPLPEYYNLLKCR